jgi:hypothetical protein
LIYTSDWFEQFRGKVWGGFLNVNRAVWEPKRNLVITQTSPGTVEAISLDDNDLSTMKIKYNKASRKYEPNDEAPLALTGIDVPFANILRITELPDLSFRVIFLDQTGHLKIVLNAEISGKFPCRALERWNSPQFVSIPCYVNGLDVTSVLDYVARTPRAITFKP